MKKFILITILFTSFFGDCFSMDPKRKRRDYDEDTSLARRTKTVLSIHELFALTNCEFLAPAIFEQIQISLTARAEEGIHIDTIVDAHGRTLLSHVRNIDYAHCLVAFGAQVNMQYYSPLFYAVTEAREHVAHFLITQCGASIDNLADHSPIHPSILVLAGGCSADFRTFLVQWRQQIVS